MTEFLTALCLAVAIEGIAYAAFPDAMRRTMAMIALLPSSTLRRIGLTVAIIGIGGIWLLRSALITP
ncbi:DUF2065 domain-containing protein [Magnetospirillum sulfuroxidans]|uniref:DUF2065 domain-containing protein n=1 Tax=Magnetospirillum sulfuroxidans TaxID=611300 RepID=A0ABS5I6R7_9PROT|nr:DUF2065 domain-containing protein [Magnetospirillum sulfuroxidans]MBR9970120.1 DUF2065 domain-containing protein [Magnetospirillum sulfuroxidans]